MNYSEEGFKMKTEYIERRIVMYDTSKLKGRIVEKFGTQGAFAEKVHCSLSFLSLYMNGKKKLDQPTMDSWIKALEIPENEIHLYFFTHKVYK